MSEKYENDLEDEEALEDEAPDPGKKFNEAQRNLVTQAVEFQIKNLAEMVDGGQIDTSPKYQRRLRWNDRRKSRLIESILMNVPIPSIFLAEETVGKYSVIDGQQRLRTISEFFKNLFKLQGLEVFSELNGKRYDDIPSELRSLLAVRPIFRCIILLEQSHPEIKFEVFERLNTGGVKLNQQEIRNSAFRGPLNDMIIDLSEGKDFRSALKIKTPNKSAIVQKMRDCELVLRFFALQEQWSGFKGSMRNTLNGFMRKYQKADEAKIVEFRALFDSTLSAVSESFGDEVFQRYHASKDQWGSHVVASIFDAEMLGAHEIVKSKKSVNSSGAKRRLKDLFIKDKDFVDAIVAGTNQHSKITYRVKKLIEVLS